jgi:hypothetical protein
MEIWQHVDGSFVLHGLQRTVKKAVPRDYEVTRSLFDICRVSLSVYWRTRHPKDPAKLNTQSTTHPCVFLHWNFPNEKRWKKVIIIKSNINLLNQISQKTAPAQCWGFFCLNLPPSSNITTHFPKPYKWGFLSNVTTYSLSFFVSFLYLFYDFQIFCKLSWILLMFLIKMKGPIRLFH